MFAVMIPKYKFWASNYPNLESEAEGRPIPEFYGQKENISPVCIDTTTLTYKIANREISSIDAVRADGTTLTEDGDYVTDLESAEFTLYGMPHFSANTLYYIVMEGTWTIDGVNYVEVAGDSSGSYSGGQKYSINQDDTWMAFSGVDLCFKLYGKEYLDGDEALQVEYAYSNYSSDYALRDGASRTKIAQSFTTGDTAFYGTRLVVWLRKVGSPTGYFRLQIHTDQAGTVLGGKTRRTDVSTLSTSYAQGGQVWNEITEQSEVECDATGLPDNGDVMDNVSDVLKDILVNVLGKPMDDLDTDAFDALKMARTAPVSVYLNTEVSFNAFIARLEAGHLFKFLPTLDGKFTVRYYQSGEPSGTPHLRDEDFLSFQSVRDPKSAVYKVKVKYDENPTTQRYQVAERADEMVRCVYRNTETIPIETYLKNKADAEALAESYHGLIKFPSRKIQFQVSGYGFNLIPTDKVKITRSRGDYSGGSYDGVLFRVLELRKSLRDGSVAVTAVLDSQSYLLDPESVSVSDGVSVGESVALWSEVINLDKSENIAVGEDVAVQIV